jgi:hypothetical protein
MHGPEERIIPGNALAVQADMPFRALQKHGAFSFSRPLHCLRLTHLLWDFCVHFSH